MDKRRLKANGTYPLKLRITYQRLQKYYKLNLESSEEFWTEVQANRRSKVHSDMRDAVSGVKAKANQVVRTLEKKDLPFDFDLFEKAFFGQALEPMSERTNAQDVYQALRLSINRLNDEDRISTAMSYDNALQSFVKFQPLLTFREITPAWLLKYEKTMLSNGRSISTVGIYLRALRTVLIQARDNDIITLKEYPLGKNKYQIPASKNVKKALLITDIRAIRNYPTKPGSDEDKNRDLWIFSYLCNGMNPKDIFRLTWGDVDGDMIRFNRKKTLRSTRSNPRPIGIVLIDPVKEIIGKWGNPDRSSNSPLFPFFSKDLSAKEWEARARDLIKQINRYMKRIGVVLNIHVPLTTYVARHSYATVMRRGGASTELISESLGHSNQRTTEDYFDSFEDDVKRNFADLLL